LNLKHLKGNFVKIGIPIEEITEVKLSPDSDPSKCTIFVRTDENSAAVIRGLLGMSESEESERFYCPGSKCRVPFQ